MADQPFLADAEDDGSSRLRITGRRRASAASAAQNAAMTEEPVEKAYGRTSMADMQPETRQAATDSKHTSKWKAHTRLRRTAWTILKPCLTALTMLICIVLYLYLGGLAYHLKGQDLDTGTYSNLNEAFKYGVTIWPILYGIIVSQTLMAYLTFRVERGVNLLVVDQVLNSRSLGNAFLALFSFSRANVVSIILLLLWALSPLGGQALQRILLQGSTENMSSVPISYLNTTFQQPNYLMSLDGAQEGAPTVGSIFTAALNSRAALAVDSWANPKIPFLYNSITQNGSGRPWVYGLKQPNSQNYTAVTADGGLLDISILANNGIIDNVGVATPPDLDWTEVQNINDSDLFYSSTLGIPLKGIPSHGTLNFTIQTGQLQAQCGPAFYNITNLTQLAFTKLGLSDAFVHGEVQANDPYATLWWATELTAGYNVAGMTCALLEVPLETMIFCDGLDCKVTKVKASNVGKDVSWNDWAGYLTVTNTPSMLQFMTGDANTAHDATATLPDQFLMKGTVNERMAEGATPAPDPVIFSKRMSIMLNTLWQASMGPSIFSNGLDTFWQYAIVGSGGYAQQKLAYQNITATHTVSHDIYECSTAWVAVLFICCIVAIFMILAYLYWSLRSLAPKILGFASSMTRDNPHTPVPRGGTFMSGKDRAVALSDMRIQLVDVEPEQDEGYVALSSVGGARLRKGRTYQ